MRNVKLAILLILLLFSSAFIIPLSSDSSDAAFPGVNVFSTNNTGELGAGDTADLLIYVENTTGSPVYAQVKSYTSTVSKITASLPQKSSLVEPGGLVEIAIPVTAEIYASTQTGTIEFYLVFASAGSTTGTDSIQFTLDISSTLSAGESYNKIMGIWASPFENSIYAAIISFAIWIVIAFIVSYLIVPALIFLFIKETREERKDIRRTTWKPFFILIMLFAAASCARIYGVGEEPTAVIESIVSISYILVGSLIVWRIYKAAVRFIFRRMSENVTGVEIDNSLVPLFDMLGKILIGVVAFASVLAALGFDLIMIITGAGIAGLAISLGAQSTLSQFFSGISLLMARPFRVDDLVKIGDDVDVLRVKRVGLMNTTFDDWSNNSTFTMPNNMVASSVINNITGKTKVYRVNVFVGISYDSDVEKAKMLMFEAAIEHPRVVKNEPYQLPAARLESFENSYVKMRVSMLVDDFEDNGIIAGQVREAIFKKFKDNDITIPLPQMDIHLEK